MSVKLSPKKSKSSLATIVKITTVLNVSRPISTSHPSKSTHSINKELSLFAISIQLNKKKSPKVGFALAAISNVSVCLAKAILLSQLKGNCWVKSNPIR